MRVVSKQFDLIKPIDFKEACKVNKALLKMNEQSSSSSEEEENFTCD
jgi:hypothetical protein